MTDLLCFVHNKLECEKLKPIIVAGFQDVVAQGRIPGAFHGSFFQCSSGHPSQINMLYSNESIY